MIRVYGISNCDSCRKTLKWLQAADAAYEFHDVRTQPLKASIIDNWTHQLGWQHLVNRRSTTWRGLDDAQRAAIDEGSVAKTLLAHPTLMKRPVIVIGDAVTVGFDEATLKAALEEARD